MSDTQRKPITVRISEACRITGMGRSKLYELIQQGEIEIVKVGTMTLVPVAVLEHLLKPSAEPTEGQALLFGGRAARIRHDLEERSLPHQK
jgi:excisionase family DNA binding protein